MEEPRTDSAPRIALCEAPDVSVPAPSDKIIWKRPGIWKRVRRFLRRRRKLRQRVENFTALPSEGIYKVPNGKTSKPNEGTSQVSDGKTSEPSEGTYKVPNGKTSEPNEGTYKVPNGKTSEPNVSRGRVCRHPSRTVLNVPDWRNRMSPGPVTSSLDQERSHKRKSASDGRKCQRKKLYRSESKESRVRRLLMAEGQQFVPATALSTKVESVESERKNPTTLKPSTSPKKGDVEAELPKLKPSTSPKKPVWNEPFGILVTSNDEPVKSEGPLDPRQSTQLYTPDWRNRVSSGAVKSSLDLKRKSASGMRQCRRKVLLKSESKESRVRRLLMAEGQQFVPASHQAALSTKVESVESERKNPTTLKPSTSQKKGDVEAELPKLKPSTSPKKPVWNEPFGILVTSE